jgi:hypothetical protein
VVGLSLKGEPETWVNIARLAGAIVTACDQIEPPTPAAALMRLLVRVSVVEPVAHHESAYLDHCRR